MPTSSSNRRDLVERRIYDLKYNTNFTASWYLVRGGVLLTSDGTLAEARSGCGVGLLAFSKFLRWLLTHYHWQTMAVLCGFMIGALRRVWPFQLDTTPNELELKHKQFVNTWPSALDQGVVIVVVVALLAMAVVFALDWMGRRKKRAVDSPSDP